MVVPLTLGASAASATLAQAEPAAPLVRALEVYDWAEVYFGTGEIAQGETLQVTVSDLRTGRIITANLGDGAVIVENIPEADRYGDTGFALTVPSDFPVGVHNLTIGTDEFAPIVIPITVTPGESVPSTQPAPAETTPPTTATPDAETATPTSPAPGTADSSLVDPPIPASAVLGVLGGVVALMIVTAIVRRARKNTDSTQHT